MPIAANRSFVDARIVEVGRSAGDDPNRRWHVVVLQEAEGERQLPIYVGPPEAIALACSLESVETPRPMHNAWQDFPARAPDLAAEVRQRQDELQAMLAEYQRAGRWGTEP